VIVAAGVVAWSVNGRCVTTATLACKAGCVEVAEGINVDAVVDVSMTADVKVVVETVVVEKVVVEKVVAEKVVVEKVVVEMDVVTVDDSIAV